MESSDANHQRIKDEAYIAREKAINLWRVLRSKNNFENYRILYDSAKVDAEKELGVYDKKCPRSALSHANFMFLRGKELSK